MADAQAGDAALLQSSKSAGSLSGLDHGTLPGEAIAPALGHRRMLNEGLKGFSDLHFVFRDKKVSAHSYVIRVRAEGLLSDKDKANLEKRKKKREGGAITIESSNKERVFAPKTIDFIFEYIYGGSVKFSAMPHHDVLHLDMAAKQYRLDRLAYLCELYLRETISLDNVHNLLKLSHDLKETAVKNYCLSFAVKNYQAFITNKTGVSEIGIDLFQEVVTRQATPNAEEDKMPPPPPADYLKHWQLLHDEMVYCDTQARVGNDKIRFHRAVLAAASEPLANHLKTNTGDEVPFNGISGEAFKSLLRFVYFGDTKLAATPATELINFCKQFDLPELSRVCEDKIRDSIDTTTVLDILAVTYLPYMEKRSDIQDLRKRALAYLLDHLTAVDLNPLRKLPPVIALDVLFACQAHDAKMPLPETTSTSNSNSSNAAVAPASPAPAAAGAAAASLAPPTGASTPNNAASPRPPTAATGVAPVSPKASPRTPSKADLKAEMKAEEKKAKEEKKKEKEKKKEEKDKKKDKDAAKKP